jgi:glycosyltransferase involved in cell wall biosynthesis
MDRFEILHLDTSDRRDVGNIGSLDARNVWLAGLHGFRFATLFVRGRIDIVYIPVSQNSLGFLSDLLFLIPTLVRGTPIVLHLHGGRYDGFVDSAPAPLQRLARAVFARAERVIVLGESLKGMLEGLVAADRIDVVPNGVPELHRAGGASPERDSRIRVLYLGNLIPGKGYVELLRAAGVLLDEGLDLEVTLAGAVADAEVHARAVAEVKYGADRIRFVGSVDAAGKAALLRSSDLVVLPSYYENEAHPLVLLEAMAAGLPVISTWHAAIPEIVVDGETGLLVPGRDVAALAVAIRLVAEHPERRAAMGRAGRRRFEERFTATKWAERMTRVFDSVTPAERS